ncbi:hypothetical protein M0811_11480 [Anaeramoeba ignava]|uniref:Phospholipase C/D domain-containing protein n=1 Tax=Anaeramoeba ignava TaxID=1746090 RepID=A0A9Q0LE27_ANAIG|nr:hypothetical protein M0811_11480 [Anaeramoeba ignava]|eukprot:Anaeramoba_ignava/a348835_312.p1 GENE.a348835_312~~a348835_312.p1  ORF type:complete len:356 (+),score=96.83 a348835_312:7-1074(+)
MNYTCLIVILTGLISTIFGCGYSTHFYISQLAIGESGQLTPELYNLLSTYSDIVQVGSSSPDWGWNFLIKRYQERSLFMHEEIFLTTSFDYVKKKFSNFNDEEAKKYLAFFIGLGGHQTADLYWHGYNGDPLAFLLEAAHKDFNKENFEGITEQIVEWGVDLFIWRNQKPTVNFKWWIPAQAVSDIYTQAGGPDVSPTEFVLGMDLLKAIILLLKTLNWFGDELGKIIEPWTHDNYMTYAPGGINHCAEMSVPYYSDAWLYLNDKQSDLSSFFAKPKIESVFDQDFEFFENVIPAAQELIDNGILVIDHTDLGDGVVVTESPHIPDLSKFLGLLTRYFGIEILQKLSYEALRDFL